MVAVLLDGWLVGGSFSGGLWDGMGSQGAWAPFVWVGFNRNVPPLPPVDGDDGDGGGDDDDDKQSNQRAAIPSLHPYSTHAATHPPIHNPPPIQTHLEPL
jgi:hypothetical protein